MKQQEFEVLEHFLQRGGSLRMLADVEQSDLNVLYQYALQLMACRDQQGAKRIFYLLMRIDQWNYDYCFSLGICCQQLHEHEEAIFCLGRAGMIKVDNPLPAYHAGLSYLALGNHDYAKRSFNASLRWCEGHPESTGIAARAQRGLATLAKENSHVN
ncbi:SycD/LcrH family type III secretion system chaperone [Shewanella baltica]|nr:SycD/LcrH family type III secretion system chaperone [Shewanella baltica]AEH13804.1 type III secretion low calcium response chaperone LcrH/SycD [Shewanella baltica OS117]